MLSQKIFLVLEAENCISRYLWEVFHQLAAFIFLPLKTTSTQ